MNNVSNVRIESNSLNNLSSMPKSLEDALEHTVNELKERYHETEIKVFSDAVRKIALNKNHWLLQDAINLLSDKSRGFKIKDFLEMFKTQLGNYYNTLNNQLITGDSMLFSGNENAVFKSPTGKAKTLYNKKIFTISKKPKNTVNPLNNKSTEIQHQATKTSHNVELQEFNTDCIPYNRRNNETWELSAFNNETENPKLNLIEYHILEDTFQISKSKIFCNLALQFETDTQNVLNLILQHASDRNAINYMIKIIIEFENKIKETPQETHDYLCYNYSKFIHSFLKSNKSISTESLYNYLLTLLDDEKFVDDALFALAFNKVFVQNSLNFTADDRNSNE